MVSVRVFLLIVAFVLFVLDGVGVPSSPRFRLTPIGLALATLSFLLS